MPDGPGVMELFPGEPFAVLFSNFEIRTFHVPKLTVVGLALPSPKHMLTLGVLAPGEAQANDGGGNKNNSSTSTETHARREQLATDEDLICSVRTEEGAPRQGPVTHGGKIKYSTAAGGCARREEPDTDDTRSGNPASAVGRTDTDAEKTRAWDEDVHIGAEDGTFRSEIIDMLSEFEDMWSGCLGRIDATKHRIVLIPGARPIYQAPVRSPNRMTRGICPLVRNGLPLASEIVVISPGITSASHPGGSVSTRTKLEPGPVSKIVSWRTNIDGDNPRSA